MSQYKEFDELCRSCGKRFGEHYGGDGTLCDKHAVLSKPYKGRSYVPSGCFCQTKGKIHKWVMSTSLDPNIVFRSTRKVKGS